MINVHVCAINAKACFVIEQSFVFPIVTGVEQSWMTSEKLTIGLDRIQTRRLVLCPGGIMGIKSQEWGIEQHWWTIIRGTTVI